MSAASTNLKISTTERTIVRMVGSGNGTSAIGRRRSGTCLKGITPVILAGNAIAAIAIHSTGLTRVVDSEMLTLHLSNCRPPLVSTMKTLAPPPFLVAAVIEALFASSEYAGLTWVVDGEADAFCAAAAYEIASDDGYVSISIFTNDSDLLIWESGWQTRIVMIDEMTENEDESGMTLQALRFFPTLMAVRRNHSLRLPDLISPAFEMLDPTFSFEQAVETADPELKSDEFMTFASMYWVKWPRAKLRAMKGATQEHKHTFPTDPRVSELVRHVLGQSRQRQCGKTGQSYNEKGDGPEKEEKKRILSEMRGRKSF